MGQLIKIQDYISRYEQDIYRYPMQYIRLKKQQWEKLEEAYENGRLHEYSPQEEPEDWLEEEPGLFDKFKSIFIRDKSERGEEEIERLKHGEDREKTIYQDEALELKLTFMPRNRDDLKIAFLNQMFQFQMKWATSTIREKSVIDRNYYLDEKLKFLLQRFPDTFLVLHQPVFLLNKAPVEADTIIMMPNETWCISFLEDGEDAVYEGSNEKFWMRRHHQREMKKTLNPLISLNRTEVIVKKLYTLHQVELPIKKAIISRTGYIDYPTALNDLSVLDKRSFTAWFESMRNLRSPMKHHQLKGAGALLEHTQTTSVHRLEWDDYNDLKNNSE
ncbi:MAG: NERD domain-containing protein [Bacillus sp. (in: firmicutes)]